VTVVWRKAVRAASIAALAVVGDGGALIESCLDLPLVLRKVPDLAARRLGLSQSDDPKVLAPGNAIWTHVSPGARDAVGARIARAKGRYAALTLCDGPWIERAAAVVLTRVDLDTCAGQWSIDVGALILKARLKFVGGARPDATHPLIVAQVGASLINSVTRSGRTAVTMATTKTDEVDVVFAKACGPTFLVCGDRIADLTVPLGADVTVKVEPAPVKTVEFHRALSCSSPDAALCLFFRPVGGPYDYVWAEVQAAVVSLPATKVEFLDRWPEHEVELRGEVVVWRTGVESRTTGDAFHRTYARGSVDFGESISRLRKPAADFWKTKFDVAADARLWSMTVADFERRGLVVEVR
jgi:hypothetical protein